MSETLKDSVRRMAQEDKGIVELFLLFTAKIEMLEKECGKLQIANAKLEGHTKGLGEAVKILAQQLHDMER